MIEFYVKSIALVFLFLSLLEYVVNQIVIFWSSDRWWAVGNICFILLALIISNLIFIVHLTFMRPIYKLNNVYA